MTIDYIAHGVKHNQFVAKQVGEYNGVVAYLGRKLYEAPKIQYKQPIVIELQTNCPNHDYDWGGRNGPPPL
ncbi:MAG: hypothetical protein ABIC91_08530 [Nanoarchaeota archaeon]|nr:hypothetical protein [Nanoarchaeota archaeon]MBU1030319.1 hypothetical protein [Nanoarchaeota archaeon]MBU1849102.1 hypothetical protein [Nanoarchaeota archaeon]